MTWASVHSGWVLNLPSLSDFRKITVSFGCHSLSIRGGGGGWKAIRYRVKDVLNKKALYTLYCSLILPYLNYACEIWGNTYTSRLQPLVNLQKKVIRIVCNESIEITLQNCFTT